MTVDLRLVERLSSVCVLRGRLDHVEVLARPSLQDLRQDL
jgi:hypothetical protein